MKKRYEVTPPVEGGYAWYNVIDTESHKYWGEDNFAVVTVFKDVPNAKAVAEQVCETLNRQSV